MSDLFSSTPVFSGQSLSQQIGEFLRTAILQGTLRPAQRLFEEALAEELQVSRTPLREALRRLEAEGLVDYSPQRGVFVRQFSLEEVLETVELRAVLQGYAAGLAAANIQPADVLYLEQLNTRFEYALDEISEQDEQVRQLVEVNDKFHQAITACSARQRLASAIQTIGSLPLTYLSFDWYSDEQKHLSYQNHKQITAALREKDSSEAERLMREHLLRVKEIIVRIPSLSPEPAGH